jgi:hypothetical protein
MTPAAMIARDARAHSTAKSEKLHRRSPKISAACAPNRSAAASTIAPVDSTPFVIAMNAAVVAIERSTRLIP